ncbi:forkhead box protein O isoform X2 [Agrilus planipennis]|uniref:Forkhead box protein O n=1 Tax=Agrilus planipennis TaxID=224129 RepID=A0A1W4WEC0_AGRPL|nr:forkhead box protein O isoform X2 [Agrilus planipennis]
MNMNMMEPVAEHDGFEPQTRARSNTWPLPRPENFVEPGEEAGNKCGGPQVPTPSALHAKKGTSRRNAWGNLSYADLITQAITSSPEKRLTLSQIYEWMVQNVPYFKDKGDSNSSAGWKNSIRHNLSLHNRFMRVQNEGTGKSSWWIINPDAKPGKSVRRRAASMETSKFEKRRGRIKRKVDALRNGVPDGTSSPSSSVSEGLDLFPDSPIHSFQLSPDFRPRAPSSTSPGGRQLSPIPAVVGMEPDWSCSPTPFGDNFNNPDVTGSYSPDQLAGNLEQGMKLQQDSYLGYLNGQSQQQGQQPPPPPYTSSYDINPLQTNPAFSLSECPVHRLQNCNCLGPVQCKVENVSPSGMSPSYSESSPDPIGNQFLGSGSGPAVLPRPPSNSPPLTPQPSSVVHHRQQQSPTSPQQQSQTPQRPSQQSQNPSAAPVGPSTMMGQLMGALNSSAALTIDDLNINIESLPGGFDCNIDEVIKHELSMEGSLDFNFANTSGGASTGGVGTQPGSGALIGHHHHHVVGHHHHHHGDGSSAVVSSVHSMVPAPSATASAQAAASPYSTTPSWVH